MELTIFIVGCSLIALIVGVLFSYQIIHSPTGDARMNEIAAAVQEGAYAYLNRQYRAIGLVGILVVVLLWNWVGKLVAVGFLIGAICSGLAGYIGMFISVRANLRTAQAAKEGLALALKLAFKGGAITGLLVVALGLSGITLYYCYLDSLNLSLRKIMEALLGLSFGASLISIFARLGGGIFTKGADVGADLVGKIEAGIPEDDPRNPAVIADNVGDNVGDCAGMAADLFETYVVTLVATMIMISIVIKDTQANNMLMYPLLIGAACILGSLLGTFVVRIGKTNNIMRALYKGLVICLFFSGGAIAGVTYYMLGFSIPISQQEGFITGWDCLVSALSGLGVTGLIVLCTEYYTSTSYRPVKSIAEASKTGHATNIIQGLAISMEACALPVIIICGGILVAYWSGGLLGIALSATAMLALAGFIIALDAYGPITDNAGGIAQMAELAPEVRNITDALDAVGNTTKAVTKGYAIGSAGLATLVLFSAYTNDLKHYFPDLSCEFSLENPFVIVGLFIGGLLPYLFAALAMTAVGRAGAKIVMEVRRQFRDIAGIMTGAAKPQYGKAVDILTRSAIKEMILPSLLPILAPIILWLSIWYLANLEAAFTALGGMLLGTIITGLFVAISMTSGGGAWDNAKKYVEEGHFGGKGSETHKATVTGDTVGDPYKDTAGPAINPLIKIINIVALLMLIVSARYLSA